MSQCHSNEVGYALAELCSERWRDVVGYEGIYEVSSLGRIRTTQGKTTESVRHGTRVWAQRYLKYKRVITGYRITLWRHKTAKDHLVARLACEAWHGTPLDNMTVNHINGNKLDNRAGNLEWLTLGDNIRHGFRTGLYPNARKDHCY